MFFNVFWKGTMERISGKHSLIHGFQCYSSTEELIKSLAEYIFNKRYNHDTVDLFFEVLSKIFQHRVFLFEESLTILQVAWLARSTIDVIMSWKEEIVTYNLIIVNEKGCEKANKRLHNPYSRSILLFYILFCFIFTTALLKRCWHIFMIYINVMARIDHEDSA